MKYMIKRRSKYNYYYIVEPIDDVAMPVGDTRSPSPFCIHSDGSKYISGIRSNYSHPECIVRSTSLLHCSTYSLRYIPIRSVPIRLYIVVESCRISAPNLRRRSRVKTILGLRWILCVQQ